MEKVATIRNIEFPIIKKFFSVVKSKKKMSAFMGEAGILIFSVFVFSVFPVHAHLSNSNCESIVSSNLQNVWSLLRQKRLFIEMNQSVVNTCGETCVVNALQAALVATGRDSLLNPLNLISTLVKSRSKTNGMLLPEVANSLQSFLSSYLTKNHTKVKVLALIGNTSSGYQVTKNFVNELTFSDLIPAPNEIKLIAVALKDSNDNVIGLHSMIIEKMNEQTVHIFDPNLPEQEVLAKYAGQGNINEMSVPDFRFDQELYDGITSFSTVAIISAYID